MANIASSKLGPSAPSISADISLCDQEIRSALINNLSLRYQNDPEAMVIEELGLCQGRVRVDIALVNGNLHGFEIKSDRDKLVRLERQVEYYSRVLDRVTLVVGLRHVDNAALIVPGWWGILTAEPSLRGVVLKQRRRGRRNPAQDARALVELVWLDEALQLLEARNAIRGFRGKPRRLVWDRVCELYSISEITAFACARLKARAIDEDPRQPS
jgi:hypothetical protein